MAYPEDNEDESWQEPEESESAPDLGLPDDILADETPLPEVEQYAPEDLADTQAEHADVMQDMGDVAAAEVAPAVANDIPDTPISEPSEVSEEPSPEPSAEEDSAPPPEAAEHAATMGDLGNVAARELPAYNPTSAMDDLRRTGREGTVESPQFQNFAGIPGMHTAQEFFPEGDGQANQQAGEAELRSAVRQTAESAASFLSALTEYVMDLGHEIGRLRTMLEQDRL